MRKQAKKGNGSGWGTLILLSMIGLVVLFDETMILPAIPDFVRDFGISYSVSSWLLSAYIIAAAVMTPIAGKLSDIYDKKKILLVVMGIYIVGVVAGRFATSIEFMIFARALQGVGMAMFPIAFGIIREVIPREKFSIGQTIFGAMFPAGAVIGLLGGAAIIQSFGWQATFLAILPVSVALWLMIFKFVRTQGPPQVKPKDKSIDVKGTVALAASITFFLTGLTFLEGDSIGHNAVGLLVAAAVSLAAFVMIEKRVRVPLIDFGLLRSRTFLPPTIILLLVFLSIFTVYLTVPVMVRSPEPLGFGGDALAVAGIQLPFMIVFLITTIASGFILKRVKNTKLTVVGTSVATIGFFFLLMFHSTETNVAIGLTILAAGLSLAVTGGFNVILTSVPMQMTGIAMGTTLLLNLVGMSVGPVFAGMIQDMNQGTIEGVSGGFPTDVAYSTIFLMAGVVSLASVLLSVAVSRIKMPAPQSPH